VLLLQNSFYVASIMLHCFINVTVLRALTAQTFDSRLGLGIFLLTIAPRPDLGPIQPPIQCVPGILSLG